LLNQINFGENFLQIAGKETRGSTTKVLNLGFRVLLFFNEFLTCQHRVIELGTTLSEMNIVYHLMKLTTLHSTDKAGSHSRSFVHPSPKASINLIA
jgi:hypothetical protein